MRKVEQANPDEVEDDSNASNWVELDEEFATGVDVDDFLRLLQADGTKLATKTSLTTFSVRSLG